MKKLLFIFCVVISISFLFSCKKKSNDIDKDDDTLNIVTTIFPIYDFTKELFKGNDDVLIDMLINNGIDIHSYNPKATDMMKLSNADLFIYVGGESDEWIEDAINSGIIERNKCLNLMETLNNILKEEEEIEGMQSEEEEEENGIEYDEHIWLSISNAKMILESIYKRVIDIDVENRKLYENNLSNNEYLLDNLKKEFENELKSRKRNVILVADRFPFRYLFDELNIDYFAAFKGCSAESEVSFETISFLSKKIDELNLKYIYILEGNKVDMAKTIINNSKNIDVGILELNSMQNITDKDVKNGISYFDIMKKNLKNIKMGLE